MTQRRGSLLGGVFIGGSLLTGCMSGSADLPRISPPVREATPASLQVVTTSRSPAQVAPGETSLAQQIHDRFFSGEGPTDLTSLLAQIDERIDGVNHIGLSPCLDAPATDYTIEPFGQSVAMFASCFQAFGGSNGFMQFGQRDGVYSMYITGGATRLAAILTPLPAEPGAAVGDPTAYKVDAWYGVGYTNVEGCGNTGTFDGCSYGVTQLHADPQTSAFEMSVAGIGLGFCGVQLGSDGTSLRVVGSTDMGMTCNDVASGCVAANDLDTPGVCADDASFALAPVGRNAGSGAHQFGASKYPSPPNITLDGTATDSLNFGPTTPTAGVGSFN